MIFLFTDFGAADIYVGQVKIALHQRAPKVPVVDLLHDAPVFNVLAGAHLLAALAVRLHRGTVTLAVVDPGVGGPRDPVAVVADGRWYVGPDNGLISVLAARATNVEVFSIGWRPGELSDSFHGRDLFAPVAGMIASGQRKAAKLKKKAQLVVKFGEEDLAKIIYVDHYGNAMTGLRADRLANRARLAAGGRRMTRARVFSEVPQDEIFWYENSLGLAEIAAYGTSAAEKLGLQAGQTVAIEPG